MSRPIISVGDIVHLTHVGNDNKEHCELAIVDQVWSAEPGPARGCANLMTLEGMKTSIIHQAHPVGFHYPEDCPGA